MLERPAPPVIRFKCETGRFLDRVRESWLERSFLQPSNTVTRICIILAMYLTNKIKFPTFCLHTCLMGSPPGCYTRGGATKNSILDGRIAPLTDGFLWWMLLGVSVPKHRGRDTRAMGFCGGRNHSLVFGRTRNPC